MLLSSNTSNDTKSDIINAIGNFADKAPESEIKNLCEGKLVAELCKHLANPEFGLKVAAI